MTKIFLACLLLTSATQAADTFFVQGLTLSLRDEPSPTAKEIAQLKRGQTLQLQEAKGLWYKVNSGKDSGWAPSIMLSKQQVSAPESILKGKEDINQGARKRSSAIATAGATRGLLDMNLDLIQSIGKTNTNALKKMMSFQVKPEEAETFLQ